MTATELRKKLYAVLNELAESGSGLTITHKNRSFRLVAHDEKPFIDRLVRHNTLKVPADELLAENAAGWTWDEESSLTTYLDTHVAAYLHAGDPALLSPAAIHVLEASESLRVSPLVQLELQYLLESGKISYGGEEIIGFLQDQFGIVPDQEHLAAAVFHATHQSWTRDPFDRIITAQAAVCGAVLLTRDTRIQDHYRKALW